MTSTHSSFPLSDIDCDYLYDLTEKKIAEKDSFDREAARMDVEIAFRLHRIGQEAHDRALCQIES